MQTTTKDGVKLLQEEQVKVIEKVLTKMTPDDLYESDEVYRQKMQQ